MSPQQVYTDGKYHIDGHEIQRRDGRVCWLVAKYPVISIEDGLDENDWEGWAALTAATKLN